MAPAESNLPRLLRVTREPTRFKRCGLGIAIGLFGFIFLYLFSLLTQAVVFQIGIAFVILSAAYGGWTSALFTMTICALGTNFFLLDPLHKFTVSNTETLVRWVLFIFLSLTVAGITNALRAAYQVSAFSSARFSELVDHLDNTIVWESHAETLEPIFVSNKVRELLQYSPDDWMKIGRDIWTKLVPTEDQAALFSIFRKAITENKDYRCEHRLTRKDGEELWFQTGVHLKVDQDAKAIFYGVCVEVTALKMAKQRSQESEKKHKELALEYQHQTRIYNTLLSTIPDFLYLLDQNHRFIYASPPLLRIWNKQLSEVQGKTFEDLGYPKELVQLHKGQLEESLRTGQAVRGENPYQLQDGNERYFEYIFVPILNSAGEVEAIAGSTRDITERKKAEKQLAQAIEDREEVLAVVSHDLRNPLGSIMMNSAILERRAADDETGKLIKKQVERIRAAGHRMNRLIEDILDLAKLEAGHFSLRQHGQCGMKIVYEAIDMVKHLADEKSIRIEIENNNAQEISVNCDHDQLLRVFANLLGNAIKFTPEDGFIRVSTEIKGSEVLFSVQDTGPGIAEDHLPCIFERYWQAKANTHKGTGLGLSIAKGIVEAHGGKIWVESKFGYGASFYFTIPTYKPSENQGAA